MKYCKPKKDHNNFYNWSTKYNPETTQNLITQQFITKISHKDFSYTYTESNTNINKNSQDLTVIFTSILTLHIHLYFNNSFTNIMISVSLFLVLNKNICKKVIGRRNWNCRNKWRMLFSVQTLVKEEKTLKNVFCRFDKRN